MISTGCIDVDSAAEGTELAVRWGNPADRSTLVRATVSRYPHLVLPSNATLDVNKISCIHSPSKREHQS
jgi:hypothetical protein